MDIDLKILLDKVRRNYPKEDLSLIEEAYNFSKEKHSGEKRVSGEDFFIHPYNVALILADLGLDPETIVAGLLHDVSHTTFSHVIDWVLGDSTKEDYQDNNHLNIIEKSEVSKFGVVEGEKLEDRFLAAKILAWLTFDSYRWD